MIDLKFTCPQFFSDLIPTRNGFFCKDCEKCIVDFRGKSKEQINDVVRNSRKDVCGIFDKNQVVRSSSGKIRSRFRLAFIAVFILGLNANNLGAQTQIDSSLVLVEKVDLYDNIRVERFVYNHDSIPVPFAKIIISQGADLYGVKCDLEGHFALDFKRNGAAYIRVEVTGIYYDTLIVEQIPTENEKVVLQIYLEYIDDVQHPFIGIVFNSVELEGIKPPHNPYDFGKTSIRHNDLIHRP